MATKLKVGDTIVALRSAYTLKKGECYKVDKISADGTVVLEGDVYLCGVGACVSLREGTSWRLATPAEL